MDKADCNSVADHDRNDNIQLQQSKSLICKFNSDKLLVCIIVLVICLILTQDSNHMSVSNIISTIFSSVRVSFCFCINSVSYYC